MSDPAEYAGRLIITWPKPTGGVLHGHSIALTDADTGKTINVATELDITIGATADGLVTADLTMLTNTDGRPLTDGEPMPPADQNGDYPTGRFHWLVTEMRVAE